VWGSDIFYVPKRNLVQKKLIEYTLTKADKILSTSNFMARQIKRYTMKEIAITPFGIDLNKFTPNNVRTTFKTGSLILGTTKALEERYGNEYIIRAFRIVKDKLTSLPLKLMLVGSGSRELYLKGLVKELQLEDDTIFTGNVPHDEISQYYNMFDIFLALSAENESFGVSILESLACETPVIVSRVGGFTELIRNEETGLIVESKNIQETADAIIRLILDKHLREQLGKNGRQFVIQNYNWDRSIQIMLDIYQQTLNEFNK
jgi:glycosyltransferase involved in cell wall biosynthesis